MAKKQQKKEDATETNTNNTKTNSGFSPDAAADAFMGQLDEFVKKDLKVEINSLSEVAFVPGYIDTGNYALNWSISGDMLNGGIPRTKIVEWYGDPGVGKTLLLGLVEGNQIRTGGGAILIDTEDAQNSKFLQMVNHDVGGDIIKRIRHVDTIDTIEQLQTFVMKILNMKIAKKDATPLVIGIDSGSNLSSEKELEEAVKDKKAKDMTRAQAMRSFVRTVNRRLRAANTTIIVLNHTTVDIGVTFGDNTTSAGHGKSGKFASSARIRIYKPKEVLNSKKIPVGVILSIKVDKNRMVYKDRKAKINISFANGVQKYSGLLEILAQYEIIKTSTKEIGKSTKFSWKEHKDIPAFGKKFAEWVEANGGDEKIIGAWNTELNDLFEQFTDGTAEEINFIDTGEPEEIEDADL